MTFGRIWIHRSEQYDLWRAITRPLVVVHVASKTRRASRRVFCLWLWGAQIGSRYFGVARPSGGPTP